MVTLRTGSRPSLKRVLFAADFSLSSQIAFSNASAIGRVIGQNSTWHT